jgi:hypothetical protein
MGLFKSSNINRRDPGSNSLLIVQKSIGYLQGGYYTGTIPGNRNSGNPAGPTYPPSGVTRQFDIDGTVGDGYAWSVIQAFNTVQALGKIVLDTGYHRRYYAGVSGNSYGHYSIDNSFNYQKFSFFTASNVGSFQISHAGDTTAIDLNVYSQAWIISVGTDPNEYPIGGNLLTSYTKIDLATDTPSAVMISASGPTSTSRQALNNQYAAFLFGEVYTTGRVNNSLYSLNYQTQTLSDQGLFTTMEQVPCGMSVDNSHGYYVGYSNIKINLDGSTGVTSYASASSYTYNFGESHSLTNSSSGFMMAGFPDTTGRYNGVQHGLCQQFILSTETPITQNDLVVPQSSGQMMAGF